MVCRVGLAWVGLTLESSADTTKAAFKASSPYTLHPAPCTLHPAPCTLRSAPCTLHPAPKILHLQSCTLNSEHYILYSEAGADLFEILSKREPDEGKLPHP